MSFGTLTDNVDGLWLPATDAIACVLRSCGDLLVLVLVHEELITLSRVNPPATEDDRSRSGGIPLSVRQARLLAIVAEGGGD